jgi:apolipoprotein N-acyltransferase
MGTEAYGQPFAILFGLVALSLLLVIVGFVLRRRGGLASRGAALGWAILCVLPLFGAGAFMWTKHTVEMATGETQPRVNEEPGRDPR